MVKDDILFERTSLPLLYFALFNIDSEDKVSDIAVDAGSTKVGTEKLFHLPFVPVLPHDDLELKIKTFLRKGLLIIF